MSTAPARVRSLLGACILVLLSVLVTQPGSADASVSCSSDRIDLDLNGDGYDDAVVGDHFGWAVGGLENGR